MGYELLGRVVWFGLKVYFRGRYSVPPRKVLAGGIVVGVIAGAVVAQRRLARDEAS